MTSSSRGRSLQLFLIDGNPDGMLTAEIFNWTGHVLMASRTQLGEALQRNEAQHTGVYILIGDLDGEQAAYVGEAENISVRIRSHDASRDWWSTVIFITSASDNLNKAHVRYLEARLVEEALKIKRVKLENGNAPSLPSLSEAEASNMEAFLEYVFLALPALRIDMFLDNVRREPVERSSQFDQEIVWFELHNKRQKLKATAMLSKGELIVQNGSQARKEWSQDRDNPGYRDLFQELVRANVLELRDDHRVFTADYVFKSPSAAAAIVNGRASNGTTEWKLRGDGRTYKQWEQDKLNLKPEAA